MLRLRVSGTIPLFFLYYFIACIRKIYLYHVNYISCVMSCSTGHLAADMYKTTATLWSPNDVSFKTASLCDVMFGTIKIKVAVSPKLLVTIFQCAQHYVHGDFTLTIRHSHSLKHFKCCTLSIFILSIPSYTVAKNQKFAFYKQHLSNLYNHFTLKL